MAPTPTPTPQRSAADKLYDKCLERGEVGRVWPITEIIAFSPVGDDKATKTACTILQQKNLFQSTTLGDSTAAFRIRSREAAEKYTTIPDAESRTVYRHVEDAGSQGIWKISLKRKTKLAEARVDKVLKALVASKHVKQLKNARANAKKTFLLYDINPGKNLTGGAWYEDGELDVEMIEQIGDLVCAWIKAQSWVLGPVVERPAVGSQSRSGKKRRHDEEGDSGKSADGAASKKRKLDTTTNGARKPGKPTTKQTPQGTSTTTPNDADNPTPALLHTHTRTHHATSQTHILLPHPPTYSHYPTVGSITDTLNASAALTDTTITQPDMRDLFRMLVADGRIERVGARVKRRYRGEESDSEGEGEEDGGEGADADPEMREAVERERVEEAACEGVEVGMEGLYRWVRRPDWEMGPEGDDEISSFPSTSHNRSKNNEEAGKESEVKIEDDAKQEKEDTGIHKDLRRHEFIRGNGPGNGFSETPCSTCSVASVCSETGPVGPRECWYFDEWF